MVNAHLPEDVILLPLYPRFSTTSTGSSFGAWHAGSGRGLAAPARAISAIPMSLASLPGMARANQHRPLSFPTGPYAASLHLTTVQSSLL